MPALSRAIVVISDFVDHAGLRDSETASGDVGLAQVRERIEPGTNGASSDTLGGLPVIGSYLERLPLAAIRSGLADFGEIWHFRPESPGGRRGPASPDRSHPYLARRSFQLDGAASPFHSTEMLEFIRTFGPPSILCVWGLGVSEPILEACRESFILYNSIDAPALRVGDEVARHFDLVLTGSRWQSEEIASRLPELATEILPIGPEFASPEMFHPIAGAQKSYDLIYVAAAQPYKRHDILFEALRTAPRRLKALCVIGYGELGDELRRRADELGLDIEFVGPPGVSYEAVNRLMNEARIGVVCGVDDGAPAILTEYMLAGLPVVANRQLRCGLQYILPSTGVAADPDELGAALVATLDRIDEFTPRQAVLDRWTWRHSIAKLAPYLRNQQRTSSLTGTSHGEPASQ